MKTAEISLKRQIWDVFSMHLYITIMALIFGLGAFWWFLAQSVWSRVYSVIFMIIYFCALYSRGHKTATHDLKGYAKTKKYPLKGFVLGSVIALSTFVFWLIFRLVWITAPNGSLTGVWRSLYNGFFICYTFVYNGIMAPYKGGIFWYAHIVMYTLPIVSVGLGYLAGYNKINLYEKILPFIYEKNKN